MPKLNRPSAPHPNPDAWRQAPRLAIFSILGLALCWLIISHSVVAYLSQTAPKTALLLRGNEPTALLALADDEINFSAGDKTSRASQPTPQRLKLWREQVETALLVDPLPAKAYRLLGQIADMEGSTATAEKFMRVAARHSLHEVFAVDWMMRKSFERKNYPAAVYYADALWRSGGPFGPYAMPILARMAEDKGAKNEIKKLLATNPNWRPGFFSALGSFITDARTPLDLFLSLEDTQAPPTTEELNAYQWFLFQNKLYELAYYVWLQFLPPEQLEAAGFLFNGGFEAKPSGSPFDWQMPAGANLIVDFASRPENAMDHALVLELGPGRVEFPGVSQSIMLPPGVYSLSGYLKGKIDGPRGAQWGVSCMNGASLGQSQMMLGSFPNWRGFEFSFVVPDAGCPAQEIKLKLAARSPSEQLVSGEIWFDSLSISRDEQKNNAR